MHEGNFANLGIVLVLYDLGCRDKNIELVALVAYSEIALDSHIETVKAPTAEILHAFFHVCVMVYKGLQAGELADQSIPFAQFALGRDYQEGSIQVLLLFQALKEECQCDSLSETPLIQQQHVLVVLKSFTQIG